MDEEDKAKQAAVLADIELNRDKDTSIEAYNHRRFGANVIVPEKKRVH